MSKFVKVSLILAGIFLAVGFCLCTISGIVGGKKLAKYIIEDEMDDKIASFVNSVLFSINAATDGEWFPAFDGDFVITDGEVKGLMVEDTSYVIPIADVKKMEVSIGAGELTVEEKGVADGNIDIDVTTFGKWEYHIEGDTLYINAFNEVAQTLNAGEIAVAIPENAYFEKVEIKVGAGVLELTDVNAKEVKAKIGAGEAILEAVEAESFIAEINAGELTAKNISCIDAELEVDLGECIFEGSISGNLEADCDLGNPEMDLTGSEKEHNYVVECDAGNIDLNDRSLSGVSAEKVIDNGAESNYEIKCGLGNITVEFEE